MTDEARPALGATADERDSVDDTCVCRRGGAPDECLGQFGGALICFTLCAGTGASIIAYGPQRALRNVFHLLPEEPGWDWYLAMGLITLLSIVTLMPIWPPMCMASGLVFGLWYGSILNFWAILGAAAVSVTLGRCVLQEPIRQCILKGDYPRVRRMMLVLEDADHSLKFQVLFRFLFIPMFIRNYGPSTLQIPVWKLIVGSIPHSIWISIIFASLGATFQDAAQLIRDGKELDLKALKWQQAIVLAVALVVAGLLTAYAHRKYAEYVDCAEEPVPELEQQQDGPARQ